MGAWEFIRRQIERLLPDGRSARLRRPGAAREPHRGLPAGPPGRAGAGSRRSPRRRDSGGSMSAEEDGEGKPRVVVLGGGPAGDVAALRAAQLGRALDPDRARGARRDVPELGVHPDQGAPGDGRPAAAGAARVDFGLVVPEVSFDFPRMMERKDEIVLKMRQGVEGAAKRKGVERGARRGPRGGRRRGRGRRALPLRPPRRLRRHRALGAPRLRHGPPGGPDLQRHPGARVGAREHARRRRRGHRLRVRQPVRRRSARGSRWWRSCPRLLAGIDGRTASQFQRCWRRTA